MSKRWLELLLFVIVIGRGGAAHAAFNANPTTIEIGTVAVGMSKTGTTDLTGDMVSATLALDTGGTCGEFSITSSPTITLSGTATTVTVKLTPTVGGDKTCTVHVTNTGDGSPIGSFGVHGTATGVPTISVTPGPLAFGGIDVGTTSGTMHVTATNNGTDTLSISGAAIVTTASNYVVTGTTGAQMVPPGGGHADWDIACKPGAQGVVNDTFRITSNAPAMMTSDVALTCTGNQGKLAVDPTTLSLDFGAVVLNGTAMLPVLLSNTGNLTVTLNTPVIDNTAVGYTVVAATVPATLTPAGTAGDHATVMVKFAPATPTDGVTSHLTFSGTWTGTATHTTTAPVVTLNGKTIALSVTGGPLTFGDFRFDAQPQKTFNIVNGGTGDILISSVTFTPDTGTVAGEAPFTITLGGTTADLATPLHSMQQYVVTVTAKPADRTGAIGGTFAVHSTGVTDIPIAMTGNSTAAFVQTTDASFGPVDIQAAHPKLTAMIMNTNKGTATLDVSAVTVMAMSGTAGVFTFTNPLPTTTTHLMPNTGLPIEVTYTPTVQRVAGDADTLVLVANLTGALDGPKQMTITIQGRGIDRDLALPASAPAFPTTFRNPGDAAPIVPITIQNTGEAVLSVTAVMASGDPVWRLLDTTPVDIAGGTSHDFMVVFAPTDIGPAPTGQLTFTTNDTAHHMAAIPLDGTGASRNVQFGPDTTVVPRTIDLGVTGTGIPITLDGALVLTSMDPGATFKIHEIRLDDSSMFQLQSPPADQSLAPMATTSFAVTFDPTATGHFETLATLYLDQDPVAQSQVLLTGDAVFVEAKGGGGCDAGGGSSGGGLVIGLAALGLIGRRRRARSVVAS